MIFVFGAICASEVCFTRLPRPANVIRFGVVSLLSSYCSSHETRKAWATSIGAPTLVILGTLIVSFRTAAIMALLFRSAILAGMSEVLRRWFKFNRELFSLVSGTLCNMPVNVQMLPFWALPATSARCARESNYASNRCARTSH